MMIRAKQESLQRIFIERGKQFGTSGMATNAAITMHDMANAETFKAILTIDIKC
ncbi:unnamed protein product [Cylicocyclus nassatus]|uniref:Uncharacterized protein n=1 Tax=Cylicocyclus nassatus TaxID=53992 RepID=A0AA36GU34_CYLNA|nr:unnamed protein product [Cylicocyclus nassatus]